jgi:hypothetical protein
MTTGPPSSNDSATPITPTDIESLDQLWGNIRLEKERKMAKDPLKIKSLEENHSELPRLQVETGVLPPSSSHTLRRQKSLYAFPMQGSRLKLIFFFAV